MTMNAQEILRLIEEDSGDDWLEIKDKIVAEAPTEELIIALQQPNTDEDTYRILCEIAGRRKEVQATPYLIEALQHPNSDIRHEAAQSITKIGSPEAGEPLLTQYLQEPSEGARVWEIIALGAVGYRPAIPHLIQALQNNDLRRYAALALAELKAQEGKDPIKQAMSLENDPSTIKLMRQALIDLDA